MPKESIQELKAENENLKNTIKFMENECLPYNEAYEIYSRIKALRHIVGGVLDNYFGK